ncbi:hypothetical protein BRARA_J00747 [Brassica rapa]|uniref:RNase H type-1 domain-containing protein n=1 Tax=Brassica campestris TaxID=3711 RepID=A0A397XIW9_BRACM|nr:hypothetical protein BRARA_J00747 [Brassica rapa]
MVCTDATWNESGLIAGLEWAFSDQRRPCISQDSKLEEFVVSPLMEKSLAYYTWIEDSQTLTKVIQKKDFIKELVGILQDIYEPFCCFSSISFIFIPRTINILADTLAKHALYVSIAG